jgi:hypothetical protein
MTTAQVIVLGLPITLAAVALWRIADALDVIKGQMIALANKHGRPS